jgi:hypothetical protein
MKNEIKQEIKYRTKENGTTDDIWESRGDRDHVPPLRRVYMKRMKRGERPEGRARLGNELSRLKREKQNEKCNWPKKDATLQIP